MFCRHGYIIRLDELRAALGQSGIETLFNKLTFKHQPKIGGPIFARAYVIRTTAVGDVVQLPRHTGQILVDAKLLPASYDYVAAPTRMPEACLALFQHQRTVIDHIYPILCGRKYALINLRAGTGKTFVAAEIARRLCVRTIYVAKNKPLQEQAIDDINDYLGAGTAVKYKRGDKDSKVSVVVINTAVTKGATSGYGLMILDEIHTYCSEGRRKIYWGNQCEYMLGMSATTNEHRMGFDKIYYKQLGDPIICAKIPGFRCDEAKFNLTVRAVHYKGPPEHTETLIHESTGRPFMHYMYGQFLADPGRCQVICQEILKLYAVPTHNIYVFAEEHAHLLKIIECMRGVPGQDIEIVDGDKPGDVAETNTEAQPGPNVAGPSDSDMGYFVGGVRDVTRIKKARIVFTTYGLSSTGLSWTHMTAMVLVTPRRAGTRQLAARILRLGSPPEHPRVIVDVVDSNTFVRAQYSARREAYAEYGAKIVKVTA